jgi:hypothetical protein
MIDCLTGFPSGEHGMTEHATTATASTTTDLFEIMRTTRSMATEARPGAKRVDPQDP